MTGADFMKTSFDFDELNDPTGSPTHDASPDQPTEDLLGTDSFDDEPY